MVVEIFPSGALQTGSILIPSGPLQTNSVLIVCSETKEAAIVDPAFDESSPIFDYVEEHGLKLNKILLTHSHWDHALGINALKKRYEISVYVHADDARNLEEPGSDGLAGPGIVHPEPTKADHLISDGDVISVGSLQWQVIHTPGHTVGSVCYYCKEQKLLISGDTLFKGSIGRISFPTSQPDNMWDSLKKLAKLPPETKVISGHGSSTTIGEEPWLSNPESMFGG